LLGSVTAMYPDGEVNLLTGAWPRRIVSMA
jgi:hypothetical protein